MMTNTKVRRGRTGRTARAFTLAAMAACLMLVGATMLPASADSGYGNQDHDHGKAPNRYVVTKLVSDQPGVAPVVDPNLVNPWGLSAGPTSALWVSDNGTDVSTLYRNGMSPGSFVPVPLVVAIPGGAPTGQVFNDQGGFAVTQPGTTTKLPSVFLFAAESGQITGWNPKLVPNTSAQPLITTKGAIYKGLAIATTAKGTFIYAADFHNNRVDVFDSNLMPVHKPFAFRDPFIPKGFAPFGIQQLGGRIYVTYAKQDADAEDDVAGAGLGFVDVFTPDGFMLRRLASRGALNAPWGLQIAPDGFGRFSGALLVGNFGDGRIHAYDPTTGQFLGTLRDASHKPIVIEGLWGLLFGNGTFGTPTTLVFSAGPGDEQHGLLGSIAFSG